MKTGLTALGLVLLAACASAPQTEFQRIETAQPETGERRVTTEARYSVIIDLPIEKAWDNLRNLGLAHLYVPGLTRTEITTELKEGVGASRRVYGRKSGMKVEMDETVIAWTEQRGFRIRLHEGDKPMAPFKNAWFDYGIEPEGGKTRLTCALGYEMPWGFFGRLLEPVLKPFVGKEVRDTALSLKYYYETGKTPTGADRTALRQQGF